MEFVAILHKKFVLINHFRDDNRRVARHLMNTALIQDGHLLALIPAILRTEYISLIGKVHENDNPFISFL